MGIWARIAIVLGWANKWYVSLVLVAVAGVLIGSLVFFKVFPGKPRVGIIEIPLMLISSDTAFVVGELLDYARQTDSIKAVVIKVNSPGGDATSSESLLIEVLKLREKKPVVISMDGVVASGAYMLSLGGNHSYAKTSSLVGNVGVVLSFPGSLVPSAPSEILTISGPHKIEGGNRRHWIAISDSLKEGFVQMVVTHRGDKLRISPVELADGRIYPGSDAVRLGLVDEIGGDTDAIEKAASLAGISHYDVVDINAEVLPIFFQQVRRTLGTQGSGDQLYAAQLRSLTNSYRDTGGRYLPPIDPRVVQNEVDLRALRRSFLPSGIGETQDEVLPGFPLRVNPPNIYYLYVGPSR